MPENDPRFVISLMSFNNVSNIIGGVRLTTPKSNQTRIIKQLEEIDKYYEDITKILQNKPVIELI